jgi:hypothetical protein
MPDGNDNTTSTSTSTPSINWQTDPDFHALPLAEKHKVLLQVDPDYKGLPPKEQAKALDTIHYGTLGQSEQTGVTGALKGMIPPPPGGGAPFLSKEFWLGKEAPSIDPTRPGTIYSDLTRPLPANLPTAALTNAPNPSGPVQTPVGNAIYRVASIFSPMGAESAEEASARGDTSNVATQAAVPAALTLAGPILGKAIPGKGAPAAAEAGGLSSKTTGAIGRTIGHATRIPGGGAIGEFLGKKFGTEAPPPVAAPEAESPASILAERQKRMAAYAEMQEDFANRARQQQKDLANRVAEAEKARQKEITDWAKLDKVSEADHQAFADRMSEIEGERQSALADMERFKEQHAASLNARKGAKPPPTPPPPSPFAGMTSSAPGAVPTTATLPGVPQGSPTPFSLGRPGGLTPPPSPSPEPAAIPVSAQPTIGSQIAERNKSSILSRGRTLYQPGEEPDMNNPVHVKIINDLQTRSGPALRTMASAGDRFAAFVLRNMPRP